MSEIPIHERAEVVVANEAVRLHNVAVGGLNVLQKIGEMYEPATKAFVAMQRLGQELSKPVELDELPEDPFSSPPSENEQ